MKKIIFALIILLSIPVYSEGKDVFAGRQKKFIKELFQSGDYFNTIAETRRLQLYDNDLELEYFIYTCYYLAGQYRTVTGQYKPAPDSNKYLPLMLLVSQSFIRLEDYTSAYSLLGPHSYAGFEQTAAFNFLLRRVEPLVLAGDFEPLDSELNDASLVLGSYPDFIQLKQDLEAFRENQGINPAAGAVMSAVIPGLGQLWSGRLIDAFLSLASVALPAAGGIYMKNQGHAGTAYTLFFFTGVFYAGNVYGGYNSAMRDNRERCIDNHSQMISRYGRYDPVVYIKFGSVFN